MKQRRYKRFRTSSSVRTMEDVANLKRRILEAAFPAAPKARGDPVARVARLALQAAPIYEAGSVVDATVDLVTRHPAADASLVKLFVHLWLAWADDAGLPNGDSGLPEAIPCVHALGPEAAQSSDPGVLLTEICHEGPTVLADPSRVAALLDTKPRTAPPGAWKTEANFFAALFSVFFDAGRTTALPALRTGSPVSEAKAYAEAAARLPPAKRRRLQLQDRSGLLQFLRDAGDVRSSQALAMLSAPVKFYRFDGATGLAEAMASASTWTDVCRVVSRSYHHLSTYGGTEARDVMLELAKTALALYSKGGSPSDAAARLFPMVQSRVVPLVGTIYSNKNVYATDACVGEWCEMNGMSLLRRPMLGFRAEFYMAAFFDRVAGETTGMPLGTVEFLCHLVEHGVRVPGSYGSPQMLLKSIGLTGFVYSRRNQPFYDIIYESMRLLAPAELVSRVLSVPLAELKSGMPTRAAELVRQPLRSKSLPVGEAGPEEPVPRYPTGADGGDADESGWSSVFMEQYENLRLSLLTVAQSMDQTDVLAVLAMLIHSLVSNRAVFRKLRRGSSWHTIILAGQTTVLALLSVMMCWYSVMAKPTSTADISQVYIEYVSPRDAVVATSKMRIFHFIPNLGIETTLGYAGGITLWEVGSMIWSALKKSDAEPMRPRQRNPGSRSILTVLTAISVGFQMYEGSPSVSGTSPSTGGQEQVAANTVASTENFFFGCIIFVVGTALATAASAPELAQYLPNVLDQSFLWGGSMAGVYGVQQMGANYAVSSRESLFNQRLKDDLPRLFGPDGLPDRREIVALNSIVLSAGVIVRYSNFYSSVKKMANFCAHLSVSIDMFYTFIAAYGPTINQLLDRFLTPVRDESDIPLGSGFTFPDGGGTTTWEGTGGAGTSDMIVRYLRKLNLSPQAYWALLFLGSLFISKTFQSSASIPDNIKTGIKKDIRTAIEKTIEASIYESLKKNQFAISMIILQRYLIDDMFEELAVVRDVSRENIEVIIDGPVSYPPNGSVARIRLSVKDIFDGPLGAELNKISIEIDLQNKGKSHFVYQKKLKTYIEALQTQLGTDLKKALYPNRKIPIVPKDYQKSNNPQGENFILFMYGIPSNVPELGSPAYLLIKAAILGSAKFFTDVDGAQIEPQAALAAFQLIVYLMEHMGG